MDAAANGGAPPGSRSLSSRPLGGEPEGHTPLCCEWRRPGKERRQTPFILARRPPPAPIGGAISRASTLHDTTLLTAWRASLHPSSHAPPLPSSRSTLRMEINKAYGGATITIRLLNGEDRDNNDQVQNGRLNVHARDGIICPKIESRHPIGLVLWQVPLPSAGSTLVRPPWVQGHWSRSPSIRSLCSRVFLTAERRALPEEGLAAD